MRFSILAIIAFALTISSCNKDIEGCTDAESENYNPDANIDNNSCVYARDKFIGSFLGALDCQAPLPNSEGFTITFSEGLNAKNTVEISFQNTAAPLPVLAGTVEGDKVIIAETQTSIAIDPTNPDVKTDLIYSGEGVLDSSGTTLTGTISVFIVPFNQSVSCDFIAEKQ